MRRFLSPLMAACVFPRRVARLRSLPNWIKSFTQAKYMHIKSGDDADDHKEKKEELKHQGNSFNGEYTLNYSPSSCQSTGNSSSSFSQMDNDDEQRFTAHAPSFWQQRNRSSKKTHLALAFSKDPEPERPSVPPNHSRKPMPPVVKVDVRSFIKCRPEYASITLDLTQRPDPIKWIDVLSVLKNVPILNGRMKASNVTKTFVELSKLHPDRLRQLSRDKRFIVLLQNSVEHLPLFSQHQLLKVLESFVWLQIPPCHPVLQFYEDELRRRASQMSLHQLLLAADLWRCIGRNVQQVLPELCGLFHQHLGQVGVPELVQLLYIIGEGRRCPENLKQPLEKLLLYHINHLHPVEIGIVCQGLFKSQTSIADAIVTRLIYSALPFVTEISELTMVNVLKYMRFSYLLHRAWFEAMAKEVPRRAHEMSVQGLMHVALACSALHYRNDSILTAIAERSPLLVQQCRSKDSCKLLWAFGTLGFQPRQSPSFYPSLIESLRQRKAEFQFYPEHLLTGLLGLAFVSQFPEDLIAVALSPDFTNLALKSTQLDLKKDLFTLDETVALELPQWTGPRLSRDLREEVTKMLWEFVQLDVCQKPEVLEAESALRDLLGGEEFVCKRMILPHTRSIDLEIHLDSNGQPIPVNPPSLEQSSSVIPYSQRLEKLNSGVSITDELFAQLINGKNITDSPLSSASAQPKFCQRLPPDEGGRWSGSVLDLTSYYTKTFTKPTGFGSTPKDIKGKVAVQLSNRNSYCYQSQQLLGFHAMKRRHLKIKGYRIVELRHWEWALMMKKSRAEKLAYLHCKLYDGL